MTDENGLAIRNACDATYHWTGEGHERESVIDLMLAEQPIRARSIQAEDHNTTSYHKDIESEVEVDCPEESWPSTGSMVELGCNDREGRRGSGEAIDGAPD